MQVLLPVDPAPHKLAVIQHIGQDDARHLMSRIKRALAWSGEIAYLHLAFRCLFAFIVLAHRVCSSETMNALYTAHYTVGTGIKRVVASECGTVLFMVPVSTTTLSPLLEDVFNRYLYR